MVNKGRAWYLPFWTWFLTKTFVPSPHLSEPRSPTLSSKVNLLRLTVFQQCIGKKMGKEQLTYSAAAFLLYHIIFQVFHLVLLTLVWALSGAFQKLINSFTRFPVFYFEKLVSSFWQSVFSMKKNWLQYFGEKNQVAFPYFFETRRGSHIFFLIIQSTNNSFRITKQKRLK